MIEVKAVVDKTQATQFIRSKGVTTDLQPLFVMCATEKDKLLGVGAVSMNRSETVIEEIIYDEDIGWLIGKALLNALELGGVRHVKIKNPSLKSLASFLRFKEENGEWIVDLEGYFESGCSGCGQN